MTDFIEINGKYFSKSKKVLEKQFPRYSDIYEAYGKPSSAKINVWNNWNEWATSSNNFIFISGRNCKNFSICGIIEDAKSGVQYYVYITYLHNYCYPVDEANRENK